MLFISGGVCVLCLLTLPELRSCRVLRCLGALDCCFSSGMLNVVLLYCLSSRQLACLDGLLFNLMSTPLNFLLTFVK